MNSKFGALPYDSYILEEMPCEHNEGYILQKFYFTVDQKSQNGSVDLEDLKIGNNSFTVSMWLNVATFHWPTDVSWSHLFSTGHNSNTEEPGVQIALRRDVKAILINTCNEAGNRGYSLGYYDQVPEVKENEWWLLRVEARANGKLFNE